MPSTAYLIAGVITAGLVTFALRALPFAVLKPLRKSRFVKKLGEWMPAGILVILAIVMLEDSLTAAPGRIIPVVIASAVTVLTHLLTKRRALVSIAAGTACFVLLVNFLSLARRGARPAGPGTPFACAPDPRAAPIRRSRQRKRLTPSAAAPRHPHGRPATGRRSRRPRRAAPR